MPEANSSPESPASCAICVTVISWKEYSSIVFKSASVSAFFDCAAIFPFVLFISVLPTHSGSMCDTIRFTVENPMDTVYNTFKKVTSVTHYREGEK